MTIIIGTPYTKGAGYFVNDKELRTRQEADVRTCTHCQGVIKMQEWTKSGAWCHKCMAPICKPCGKIMMTQGCVPFLQKIEKYAQEQMRYEKLVKDVGPEAPGTHTQIYTGAT